ncbi:MAG: hypothetical protein WDO18_00680 [Acidobacteriota bacterium]
MSISIKSTPSSPSAKAAARACVQDRVTLVTVATAEKLPRRVRLIVNGTSGHGSVPRTDNALVKLSAAVEKLGTWETPMRLNDTTRTYFERLGTVSTPVQAARYNGLLDPARTAEIQRYSRRKRTRALFHAAPPPSYPQF